MDAVKVGESFFQAYWLYMRVFIQERDPTVVANAGSLRKNHIKLYTRVKISGM